MGSINGRINFTQHNREELKLDSIHLWNSYLEKDADAIEYLSDYGVILVYLGNYKEAKAIYEQIEVVSPNRYTTASNLGTIYELIGKPDSALIWIKRSMDLNPDSHEGSEWIHIKILEAQIKGTTEDASSILRLDFGTEAAPENLNGYNLQDLANDIYYQVRERLQFVDAPNKTVGNLYFDYGNTTALSSNVESALESYAEAERFGFQSELMVLRKDHFKSLTRFTNFRRNLRSLVKTHPIMSFFALIIGLVLMILIFIVIYKKIKNITLKT